MNKESITLGDIRSMRLERHWSQEQLAEMSGLSVRTIQRIEKGEKAGLESVKALASVFETDIVAEDSMKDAPPPENQSSLKKSIRGLYKLLFIAVLNLLLALFFGFADANWSFLGWFTFSWLVILAIYVLNNFDTRSIILDGKLVKKKD